ncbi:hypothetical protein, partial [Pseudorhodoplanes sp.]|uniref:hypothetical protein n=1 Tax=Pseudorhodoplanes sp. TaxID=1934341 RepID=UPI003D0DF04A
ADSGLVETIAIIGAFAFSTALLHLVGISVARKLFARQRWLAWICGGAVSLFGMFTAEGL